jgi:hypothetical protein
LPWQQKAPNNITSSFHITFMIAAISTSPTSYLFSMDSIPTVERPQHRRNKSASVLKSMMPSSKSLKRTQTVDSTPTAGQFKENAAIYNPLIAGDMPMLPPNHPHAGCVLGEIHDNNSSPRRTNTSSPERPKPLHKKTLSTISLRSVGKSKDNDEDDSTKRRPKSSRATSKGKETHPTPTKSKSATSLTSVFTKSVRGRPSKKETSQPTASTSKDKENTTPPGSSSTAHLTPIWAQFASPSPQEISTTTKVPLNDRKRAIAQEMKLYLPKEYTPSKQRNFFAIQQPTLERKRERPRSEVLDHGTSSTNIFDTFTKKTSNEKSSSRPKSIIEMPSKSSDNHQAIQSATQLQTAAATAKKGSRVMAAVAVFNNKAKERDVEPKMDPKQIDIAFEAVLVRIFAQAYHFSSY